jgi:hypothetical protein
MQGFPLPLYLTLGAQVARLRHLRQMPLFSYVVTVGLFHDFNHRLRQQAGKGGVSFHREDFRAAQDPSVTLSFE